MKRKRFSVQFSVGFDPRPQRRGTTSKPVATQPDDSCLIADEQRPLEEPQPSIAPDRSPFSLLITDDDDAFRETLRSIFEPEGFHTLLAHCGEEALDILGGHQVHLALLDQNMPRLTGLETLRIIRRMNAILPVILMTADFTQHLLREALSVQAFCVMPKPLTRTEVVTTVHQALSRSYDLSQHGLRGRESTL